MGINPDKCEEVIQALRDVVVAKFKHGKRWGCNKKQRNLKRRWEICMEVVGRKCMDNATLSKIKLTDEIVDECTKEKRNKECENMLDQADCWMGRRNKTFRLMMD